MKNAPYIEQFLEKEMLLFKEIANDLARDPYVLASYKNWKYLDDKDRDDFILYFAKNVATQMGRFSPLVVPFNDPPKVSKWGGEETMVVHYGFFRKEGPLKEPTLHVNMNPETHVDLKGVCETLAHEEIHDRQELIMEGKVKDVEPCIGAILKWERKHYIPDGDQYTIQLCEQHAFRGSEYLIKELFSALEAKSECVLNSEEGGRIKKEYEETGRVTGGCLNGIQPLDPRFYYYKAQSLIDNLAWDRGHHVFRAILDNYEFCLRYGEYTHGFNLRDPAEGLLQIACGSGFLETEKDCYSYEVPKEVKKIAKSILEKYKDRPSGSRLAPIIWAKLKKLEHYEQSKMERLKKDGKPQRRPPPSTSPFPPNING